MKLLSKKGDLKRILMIFIVGMLLFFVINGILSFALTPEEEKQQLDAELAEIEQKLAIISAGFGQDFGGLVCGVDRIKYNDYKCDNIGFHVVKVLTVGVHNQRFNFSDFIADAHNLASLANVSTNGSVNRFVDDSECLMVVKSDCGLMAEEVIKIKIRIQEVKDKLKKFEVRG